MTHTKERVRVVRCDAKYVWLEPIAVTGCSSCELNKGCGTGMLSKLLSRNLLTIRIPTSAQLNQDDEVWINVPQQALLLASVVLYLTPLLGLLFGAFLGQFIFTESEPLIILSTILFFFLSFLFARRWSFALEKKAVTQITISGISADNIVLQMH